MRKRSVLALVGLLMLAILGPGRKVSRLLSTAEVCVQDLDTGVPGDPLAGLLDSLLEIEEEVETEEAGSEEHEDPELGSPGPRRRWRDARHRSSSTATEGAGRLVRTLTTARGPPGAPPRA